MWSNYISPHFTQYTQLKKYTLPSLMHYTPKSVVPGGVGGATQILAHPISR